MKATLVGRAAAHTAYRPNTHRRDALAAPPALLSQLAIGGESLLLQDLEVIVAQPRTLEHLPRAQLLQRGAGRQAARGHSISTLAGLCKWKGCEGRGLAQAGRMRPRVRGRALRAECQAVGDYIPRPAPGLVWASRPPTHLTCAKASAPSLPPSTILLLNCTASTAIIARW